MRRVSFLLVCLLLIAFRPNPELRIGRADHAGPAVAAELVFEEFDTPARYFPSRWPTRRAEVWEQRSNVAQLLQPIPNARVVPGRGQALETLLATLPKERRALGVSGLTPDQLRIVCEEPEIDFDVEHDGARYEARYNFPAHFWMTEPAPSLYALTSTCTDALLATSGAVSDAVGAGCATVDEQAHFPESSRCRSCVEVDGDHGRCVAANECKAEMTREIFAAGEFWDVLEMKVFSCAPDHFNDALVLTRELGEDNIAPDPFSHDRIFNICTWFWSPRAGERRLFCQTAPTGPRPAVGDVLVGRVVHIRSPGSTATPHSGRLFFSSGMEIEGHQLTAMPLVPSTIGPLSDPDRRTGYGWNPQALRADGTDPQNIDHTFARDWIAAVSLKTATEIEGVPISYRNRNLCTDDMWRGPDTKGRYFCKEPIFSEGEGPPNPDRWAYDYTAFYYQLDPPDLELRPMMTLAATGLMDPNIPGGHVSKIYGSETLTDPDWENCRWPDTFEPDEMLTFVTEDGAYTHTSQTYRFSKDLERNIRLTLSTSWRRTFCPGVAP